MKKKLFFAVSLALISSAALYPQHTAGDVMEHEGWYSLKFEFYLDGRTTILVTQKYPSGEEYEVVGDEREELPLYLKFLALGSIEEMAGSIDFDSMTFNESGLAFYMDNISFTLLVSVTSSEEEIMQEWGDGVMQEFKNRRWP